MTNRGMSPAAIAARRERVRRLLLKDPTLTTAVVQERTMAGDDMVRAVRRELAAGTPKPAPVRARVQVLEAEVARLGDRVAVLEGPARPALVVIDAGELIRARQAAGWTREQLSEWLDVSRQTLWRWEKRKTPCQGDNALKVHALFVRRGAEPPALR